MRDNNQDLKEGKVPEREHAERKEQLCCSLFTQTTLRSSVSTSVSWKEGNLFYKNLRPRTDVSSGKL